MNQDFGSEHYELLMIDNNSTDRSAAIVDEYSESGVTLLREPKQGAYAARNRGLADARGEVIVFTDPDCVPRHDWLRLLTQPLECPDVEIVMGRALLDAHSPALQTLQDYEKSKDEQIYGGDDVLVYIGRTNNMAVRRRLFDQLGSFEERQRGADTILVRRCVDRYSCDSVHYQPTAEVVHLEVANLLTYYRKIATYARSHTNFEPVVPTGVMDRDARREVFRRACQDNAYSLPRRALLLALMGLEGFSWTLGAWRARRAGVDSPSQS